MALNQTTMEINEASNYKNIMSAEIFRVQTGSRRNIGKMGWKNDGEGQIHTQPCPIEIDSHADTHCFERNFRPMHWTGQECSVAPFLAEYSE